MDQELRAKFNEAWSPELYERVQKDLKRRLGCEIPFPVAETPIFLAPETATRFATAAREIVKLISEPDFIALCERAVPETLRGPRRDRLPQFLAVDFAVVREEDGTLGPRLVELQGFPSLYGFQIMLADVWATHLQLMKGLPDNWRLFFSGMDRYGAMALVRQSILGDCEPEDVCLLDLDPENQKTYPDFAVTQRWFGVDPVCLTKVEKDGDRLFRTRNGERVPIRRFYHRIVFDEVERAGVSLPFDVREPLQVEWAPHPAWFFLWSKDSLLDLDHPVVPKTTRVSDLKAVPDDLSRYVLKPVYSFAGVGVNLDPTEADLEALPQSERPRWVLQEKVEYAPIFESVEGHSVKGEMRLMFVRPDDHTEMTLLLNLVRLSRGKMMGVDHNQGLSWTGASVAIWPA
ncbi:MAG: hypothetical protein O7E54_08650 [Planctomycetota bacterium]|nr:hypothetical protein [Planctomycetota bacterium]